MSYAIALASLANGVLTDQYGNVLQGRQVYVYEQGTTTQVDVYSDSGLSQAATQPLVTTAAGIPGYVKTAQSLDFVDAASGDRVPAEAISARDIGSGTGTVVSIVPSNATITVDDSDPANPTIAVGTLTTSQLPTSVVSDSRGSAAQDMLLFNGSSFVRLPVGSDGQRLIVRSDGTIGYEGPLEIPVDAWGAVGNGTSDDSTAFTNAMISANTAGAGTVTLTPHKRYAVKDLDAPSNVTIDGRGATIVPASGLVSAMIYGQSGTAPINFGVHSVIFDGTGMASTQPAIQFRCATRLRIHGCVFQNCPGGGPQVFDCADVWVHHNYLSNVGTGGSANAINLVSSSNGNTVGLSDVLVTNNILTGCNIENIALVITPFAVTTARRIVIAHNTINLPSGFEGIEIENAGNQPVDSVLICNNIINGAADTNSYGIMVQNDAATASLSPTLMTNIKIAGNIVTGVGRGIQVTTVSDSEIIGNRIYAQKSAISLGSNTTASVSFTANTTSGSNQLTDVTGATGAADGMLVQGTGIPVGSYIASGAGTATWTLTCDATATAAGASLTAIPMYDGNVVANNKCRLAVNAAGVAGLSVTQNVNGEVLHNRVEVDPGSTTGLANGGILVSICGWMRVEGNRSAYSPAHGLQVKTSNNVEVARNWVRNPGEIYANTTTGTYDGILLSSINDVGPSSPFSSIVRDNNIFDERAAMATGLAGPGGSFPSMGNRIGGYRTAASSGITTVTGV